MFGDVPGSYEVFGDSPLSAAREYAVRKWNARGGDEFDAAVNGPASERVQPGGA